MLFDEVCLNSVILLHDLLYFPGGLVSKKIGSCTNGLKEYLHIVVNQNLVKDVWQQIDQLRVVMEEKRGKGHAARCPPGRVTITIFLLTFYVTLVCSLCYPSCKALGKFHSSCQILDLSINLLLFWFENATFFASFYATYLTLDFLRKYE